MNNNKKFKKKDVLTMQHAFNLEVCAQFKGTIVYSLKNDDVYHWSEPYKKRSMCISSSVISVATTTTVLIFIVLKSLKDFRCARIVRRKGWKGGKWVSN